MKAVITFLVFVQISMLAFSQQTDPPYKRFPTAPPLKLLLTDSSTIFTDKELKKELTKQKTLFKQLEDKIADLNKKKTQLELDLASPGVYGDKTKFQQTEAAYKTNTDDLKKANAEYEIVFEKLMELEEKI